MKDNNTFLRLTVIVFAVLSLVNYFWQQPAVNYACALLLLLIILQAWPKLDRITGLVVGCLFLLGGVLLVWSGASLELWVSSLLKNANLATLFICVPMMSLPFFYEDYQSELKVVVQTRMQHILGFCFLVAVCTHFLAVLISVGAMMVMYELMHPYADLYKDQDTFLCTLTRAYNSSGFWSPAWASMIVLNSQLAVPWVSLIPIGLAFSVIFLGLDLGGIYLRDKLSPGRYPRLKAEEGVTVDWRKIRIMVLLAAALIGSIIVLNLVTPWDLLIIVPLVSVFFPIAAALLQKHGKEYKAGMQGYYKKSLLKVQSQCALFTAAGFLGKALDASGVGELLPQLLPDFFIHYPVLMVGAVMLLLILPSLIGVHPAATGTALVLAVTPASLGLDLMTFCLTILTGWLIAIMVSPFSANNLMLSGLTGRSSWSISLGLNLKFGLLSFVVFSLLISLIGPLL